MKGSKRNFSIFMVMLLVLSTVLPVLPMQQAQAESSTSSERAIAETAGKTVELHYIREDGDFEGWNIWTWNTGVEDGQVNFDAYEDGVATATIPVSEETDEFGFVLRSTENWDTAEKEFGDRFIQVSQNDAVTKAYITSGVEEVRVVPDGSAPVIDEGNATFFYRDMTLFANGEMEAIDKVELKLNGETKEMAYEAENERFVYTYENLPVGVHAYSYLVTDGGETREVTDPYNTIDGESVINYEESALSVTGNIQPQIIDYNENAVLTVQVDGLTDGLEIAEIYADMSTLGGSGKLAIDPELQEVAIAVDDTVSAGKKTIPITVVDSFGNDHEGTAEVEVRTRQAVGEGDFDWDESIIYFMLTDRFFDGNEANNDPENLNYDTSKRGAYQGGDFAGITEKLDYLEELGVNTIWMSPIVDNIDYDVRFNESGDESYYGYHGYWANDFDQLNPHFGSMEEFHTLIDEAHARDMKIMVDVVLNHTGYGLKELDGNLTESERPLGYPTDEDRKRFSDLVRQGSDVGTDEVVGELSGLPDFQTEDPQVRKQIIDWQTSWIDKATTDEGNTIDYFRVDTVKHVEDTTWMAFKNAITKKMPEHKMIGEAWGASANDDYGYLDSGMMDSLLDFGFKGIAHDFVNGNLATANEQLTNRNGKIDNTAMLGQFLGSHDEDGFLYSTGGDEGKLKVAASLQATAKGQPVIYYGEELGQSGANNYPQYDNRYDLAWDEVENNDILNHYQKILTFRGDHSEVFAKGERKTIGGTDTEQYSLFERTYDGESVYVGLNVANEAQQMTLELDKDEATVRDNYSDETFTATDGKVTVSIPAAANGGTALFTVNGAAITGVTGDHSAAEPIPENSIRIHYQRDDGNYENYGAWLWNDVKEPSANWPTGAAMFDGFDEYGAYVDVELAEGAGNIGFLVMDVTKGDAGKDGGDKSFSLLDQYNEIWIKQGDDTVYVSQDGEVPKGFTRAEVTAENTLELGFTATDGLTADYLQENLKITDAADQPVTIDKVTILDDTTVEVTGNFNLEQLPLNVTFEGKTITAGTSWKMIDQLYAYEGDDLGATYQDGNATLKLWAPQASDVAATFYDKNDATKQIGTIELENSEKGVWTANIRASVLGVDDLDGYFYQYQVTNDGVTKDVLDPYAKSMAAFTVDTTGEAGSDGDVVGKAAIVDLNGTDPEGFTHADIDGYEKREDAVIYETHIRDFTSDPSIAGDLDSRWGSYTAFIDKLDYIQSLGVTHVQLLPVMAWYYGDETQMDERELEYSAGGNEYNWGYDPHSYFSPDGAYSEDPKDPKQRVEELKQLIDAIHDAGMGVVLDVVYTHMAQTSTLNDIVPDYYAFQDAQGNFLGGFGNNLATNHHMAEKLMVDSVAYWFDEYKIDGMRFDMMGDATYPAIQNAYDAAETINPNALFIGEGWRTFAGHLADPSLEGMGADQDWMDKTDDVGVFSDEIRNELKSGFGSEGEPRFLTNGPRDIQVILNNIKGQPSNTAEDDPGDIVQYIAAHDNLPLYDVIAQSIKKDPAIPENNEEIHKRIRLGNAMILTSQGTAFLHSGQEYGRTKQWHGEGVPEQKYHEMTDENGNSFGYFIHDSYDSSDAVNMFDWKKATNAEKYPTNVITKNFTSGMIELRKSTNAFRLGDKKLVNENVVALDFPEIGSQDLIIAYEAVSTDDTGNYYVFVNADDEKRTLTLGDYDFTDAEVLVDSDEAGSTEVSEMSGFTLDEETLTIDPLTTVVLKLDERRANEELKAEQITENMVSDFLAGETDAKSVAGSIIDMAIAGDVTPSEAKTAVLNAALDGEYQEGQKYTGKQRATETAGEKVERSLEKMLKGMDKGEKNAEKNALKQVENALEKVKRLS